MARCSGAPSDSCIHFIRIHNSTSGKPQTTMKARLMTRRSRQIVRCRNHEQGLPPPSAHTTAPYERKKQPFIWLRVHTGEPRPRRAGVTRRAPFRHSTSIIFNCSGAGPAEPCAKSPSSRGDSPVKARALSLIQRSPAGSARQRRGHQSISTGRPRSEWALFARRRSVYLNNSGRVNAPQAEARALAACSPTMALIKRL